MATVLLVRHARSQGNVAGVLVGRTAGVHLDTSGSEQAAALGAHLAPVPLARLVSSPLERCLETAARLALPTGPGVVTDERLSECGYGDWTGRTLLSLIGEPLWPIVQAHPSAVRFPSGESFLEVQARAVSAVREHDSQVEQAHGPGAIWLALSHADVIKTVLADALGLHLDMFQRLIVDPCSVTVVRYTTQRPYVMLANGSGADLAPLVAAQQAWAHAGGGSGPGEAGSGAREADLTRSTPGAAPVTATPWLDARPERL